MSQAAAVLIEVIHELGFALVPLRDGKRRGVGFVFPYAETVVAAEALMTVAQPHIPALHKLLDRVKPCPQCGAVCPLPDLCVTPGCDGRRR